MEDKPTTGLAWLRRLLSGKPHYIIGGAANPYMLRWYLIPRNTWFNIYLHKFLRSDDDRALHDHPWRSLSIILRGGYYELKDNGTPHGTMRWYGRGSFIMREATYRHRIILDGETYPWTLFITGRKVRDWGFWCPKGFVRWQEFTAPHNSGEIGRGCE